jgi:hypothetical protein
MSADDAPIQTSPNKALLKLVMHVLSFGLNKVCPMVATHMSRQVRVFVLKCENLREPIKPSCLEDDVPLLSDSVGLSEIILK